MSAAIARDELRGGRDADCTTLANMRGRFRRSGLCLRVIAGMRVQAGELLGGNVRQEYALSMWVSMFG